MSRTIITNAGIAAAVAAEARGMKIAIDRFKIGSYLIPENELNPSSTSVFNEVYDSGPNTNRLSVSVLSSNTLIYRVRLDEQIGNFSIGNIGLFLTDGTLFSLTALPSVVEKRRTLGSETGNVLVFHIIIQINNISSVMNVSLNLIQDLQIPEVVSETNLPSPQLATSPIYYVRNFQNTNIPALATRLLDPINKWHFVLLTQDQPLHLLSNRNLSDVQNVSQARANLGLGTAATKNVGVLQGNVPVIGEGNVLPREILPIYQGATNLASGVKGAVPPAPAGSTSSHVLFGDGVWRAVGTAAFANTGTSPNNVPILGSDSKINRVVLPVYQGATPTQPGQTGSVPPAPAGATSHVLFGDGSWGSLGTAAFANTGTSANNVPVLGSDSKLNRVILPIYQGATPTQPGQTGSVPPASAGQVDHIFTGDGSWKDITSIVKVSPAYSFSPGNNVYSHGLGRHPIILSAYIECISSDKEWNPGDRIIISAMTWNEQSSPDFIYLATTTTSVILLVRSFKIVRKTASDSAEPSVLNYSSWRFRYVYI